jgi:hypothetical protein
MYESFERLGVERKGLWCGWSCSSNLLRAFVVHPKYAEGKATMLAVDALHREQTTSGQWSHGIPFYHTVNALAHLDSPSADLQLQEAFNRLAKTQRRDGTWGGLQREWNAFLIVHALKNKGAL